MRRSDFSYNLPDEQIALYPPEQRGSSRMLCVDSANNELADRMFTDLPGLLTDNDLLVFNDTQVIPARLNGHKETGGKVEILVERIVGKQRVLAHVRASKSPRPGSHLLLEDAVKAIVHDRRDDLFELEFSTAGDVMGILAEYGHIPLPPYICREDGSLDRDRYQTVYADKPGAVAAPTAGLHFNEKMLDDLKQQGVRSACVTLHIGAGTFQPVRADNLSDHVMHQEYYELDESVCQAITETRNRGGRVVAVGTTVVRTLESAARTGELQPQKSETDLFITPGYRFRIVDALLTNFHLSESTLLMLVCAFAGYQRAMDAYRHAIEDGYRFYSYGDAMFLPNSDEQA